MDGMIDQNKKEDFDAQSLAFTPSVKISELKMRGNNLQNKVTIALLKALQNTAPNLRVLDLADNNLTEQKFSLKFPIYLKLKIAL